MGFVTDVIGGFTESGADAAKSAGNVQAGASENAARGIDLQRGRALDVLRDTTADARASLAPFRAEGENAIRGVGQLVSDPNAQRDFINNNPFFSALADESQRRLFNNQAAQGRVGSGETAQALQNSILLLGNDLLSQNVDRRLGIGGLGLNAATTDAGLAAQRGINDANIGLQAELARAGLTENAGAAQASGIVGSFNVQRGEFGKVLDDVLSFFTGGTSGGGGDGAGFQRLSDARFKENIRRVGQTDAGIPIYTFRYRGDPTVQMGVMAQEAPPGAVVERDGVLYVDYAEIH